MVAGRPQARADRCGRRSAREEEGEEDKTPPSIVIDRYYFKEDKTGYLGSERQHLYVFDVASRKAEILTPGAYDEAGRRGRPTASRSPFFSKRGEDPDRSDEFGLYVMAAQPGATPQLLTTSRATAATALRWRRRAGGPDGRELAFVAAGDPEADLLLDASPRRRLRRRRHARAS